MSRLLTVCYCNLHRRTGRSLSVACLSGKIYYIYSYQFALVLQHHSLAFTFLFRQLLACLHFNENSDRAMKTNQDGAPIVDIYHPKQKHKEGGFSLRIRKEASTYSKYKPFEVCLLLCTEIKRFICTDYVKEILDKLRNTEISMIQVWKLNWETSNPEPGFLSSAFQRPDAQEARQSFYRRFSVGSSLH